MNNNLFNHMVGGAARAIVHNNAMQPLHPVMDLSDLERHQANLLGGTIPARLFMPAGKNMRIVHQNKTYAECAEDAGDMVRQIVNTHIPTSALNITRGGGLVRYESSTQEGLVCAVLVGEFFGYQFRLGNPNIPGSIDELLHTANNHNATQEWRDELQIFCKMVEWVFKFALERRRGEYVDWNKVASVNYRGFITHFKRRNDQGRAGKPVWSRTWVENTALTRRDAFKLRGHFLDFVILADIILPEEDVFQFVTGPQNFHWIFGNERLQDIHMTAIASRRY